MIKNCAECGRDLDRSEFGKTSKYCRACSEVRKKRRLKRAQVRWLSKNPEYSQNKNKAFYAANRDREKARAQQWKAENREKVSATSAEWRSANLERHREMNRSWYRENEERRSIYRRTRPDAAKMQERAKAREWKRNNPERCAALNVKRLAQKLRASPSWADQKKIAAIYADAARITAETGILHHVDHIIPLVSKLVCGLHVETNLQILPASVNQSKSNRTWPDALKDVLAP